MTFQKLLSVSYLIFLMPNYTHKQFRLTYTTYGNACLGGVKAYLGSYQASITELLVKVGDGWLQETQDNYWSISKLYYFNIVKLWFHLLTPYRKFLSFKHFPSVLVFSCEFCDIFKNSFFTEDLQVSVSK